MLIKSKFCRYVRLSEVSLRANFVLYIHIIPHWNHYDLRIESLPFKMAQLAVHRRAIAMKPYGMNEPI